MLSLIKVSFLTYVGYSLNWQENVAWISIGTKGINIVKFCLYRLYLVPTAEDLMLEEP